MAIQPIDLQAIFSQIDKVGKNQAVLREGQHIQDALQQVQTQRKLEENVRSVNESQKMGEEAETIKDGKGHGPQAKKGGSKEKQEENDDENAESEKTALIRDPALGRNIDISG